MASSPSSRSRSARLHRGKPRWCIVRMRSSPVGSSRKGNIVLVLAAACALLGTACATGSGEGSVTGTLTVTDCGIHDREFSLKPTFFAAEVIDDSLDITIRHGSDLDIYSNGLHIVVADTDMVKQTQLGTPIDLSIAADAPVSATFYLNETCGAGRHDVPVRLAAVEGAITFNQIYAPDISKKDVEIAGTFDDVTFE